MKALVFIRTSQLTKRKKPRYLENVNSRRNGTYVQITSRHISYFSYRNWNEISSLLSRNGWFPKWKIRQRGIASQLNQLSVDLISRNKDVYSGSVASEINEPSHRIDSQLSSRNRWGTRDRIVIVVFHRK